jgi:hypothetical protein
MRLGQLARKLSLRPTQIVEFLAKNNIQIEENSNTRIEDNYTELVVNHFAPGTLQQVTDVVDEPEEMPVLENESIKSEPDEPLAEPIEPTVSQETEVIRAQKIELSGLKVLGKIELPEPKKKEPAPDHAVEETESKAEDVPVNPEKKLRSHDKKLVGRNRERTQPRQWKNPLELQRELEAREADEKKRVEAQREKEKRKKHYEEKRKVIVQPKRVKPVKEQPEMKKPVDTRPVPKTWLGKFLRWWTN